MLIYVHKKCANDGVLTVKIYSHYLFIYNLLALAEPEEEEEAQ